MHVVKLTTEQVKEMYEKGLTQNDKEKIILSCVPIIRKWIKKYPVKYRQELFSWGLELACINVERIKAPYNIYGLLIKIIYNQGYKYIKRHLEIRNIYLDDFICYDHSSLELNEILDSILDKKEMEVLNLIVEGYKGIEISEQLGITPQMVSVIKGKIEKCLIKIK